MNRAELQKQILDFTTSSVECFLKENPGLEFYAFAFDCNAEYAKINLCFNTEESFEKTLEEYRSGDYSKCYQSEKQIEHLKFNTGDWDYQCFATLDILSEEELTKMSNDLPDDEYGSWDEFAEGLLNLFTEALLEFAKTETYGRIPKTTEFIAYCIDHDENFEDAMLRLNNAKI